MQPDDPRARLTALAAERATSLASLSAMIGRGPAYLHQWVRYGRPRALAEGDRRMLANFFGVSQAVLGGDSQPEPWRVPRLDVAASAGPGATPDDEVVLGGEVVTPELARSLGLREGQASIICVAGDSMAPGLMDGDRLLIDQGSRAPDARGGVYVIRVDGVLLVKRVRRQGRRLLATSDNPDAAPVPDAPIEVIGRAVWQMRAPR